MSSSRPLRSLAVALVCALALTGLTAAASADRGGPTATVAKKCKKKRHRKCRRHVAPAAPTTYDLDFNSAIAAMKGELNRIGTIDHEQSGAAVYYKVDTSSCEWGVAYTGGHSLTCYGYLYEQDSLCSELTEYDWNRHKYQLTARLQSVYTHQVVVGSFPLGSGFHCADLDSTGTA